MRNIRNTMPPISRSALPNPELLGAACPGGAAGCMVGCAADWGGRGALGAWARWPHFTQNGPVSGAPQLVQKLGMAPPCLPIQSAKLCSNLFMEFDGPAPPADEGHFTLD